MREELQMNEFLADLKKIFDQYGVKTVYMCESFTCEKDDGLVYMTPDIDAATANKLCDFVDNYVDKDWFPPELRSFVISVTGQDMPDIAGIIYENGIFYSHVLPKYERSI